MGLQTQASKVQVFLSFLLGFSYLKIVGYFDIAYKSNLVSVYFPHCVPQILSFISHTPYNCEWMSGTSIDLSGEFPSHSWFPYSALSSMCYWYYADSQVLLLQVSGYLCVQLSMNSLHYLNSVCLSFILSFHFFILGNIPPACPLLCILVWKFCWDVSWGRCRALLMFFISGN